MKIHRIAPCLLLALLLASAGCDKDNTEAISAPPPPPKGEMAPTRTYDYTQKALSNGRDTAGRKWTVAILRFGDTKEVEDVPFGSASQPAAGGGQVNVNVKIGNDAPANPGPNQAAPMVNKRAREALKHELVKSEAFVVVERERILEILREINFGKTKYVDPAGAPEEGELLSVRYLLEGSLGFNEDKTLKDTIDGGLTYKDGVEYQPGLFDNIFNPGKVNREKMLAAIRKTQDERAKENLRRKYNIACYLSVYEVQTGMVTATVMGLGSNGTEAIQDAVEELIDELTRRPMPVRVAAVIGDKVYLDLGAGGGMKVGSRYQILHTGQVIRDKDGAVIGKDETEVAEVEVTEVQSLLSIAKVVGKAGDIVRGDTAKPAKH